MDKKETMATCYKLLMQDEPSHIMQRKLQSSEEWKKLSKEEQTFVASKALRVFLRKIDGGVAHILQRKVDTLLSAGADPKLKIPDAIEGQEWVSLTPNPEGVSAYDVAYENYQSAWRSEKAPFPTYGDNNEQMKRFFSSLSESFDRSTGRQH